MRWAKVILIFQALVTLIIGAAFFSQLTLVGLSDFSEMTDSLKSTSQEEPPLEKLDNIKNKYSMAAYILLTVGLIELILIMRLIS